MRKPAQTPRSLRSCHVSLYDRYYKGTYVEWDERVSTVLLPEEEHWEEDNPNDDRGDNLGLSPLFRRGQGGKSTCKCERGQEETKGNDYEQDADDIALPEQVDKDPPASALEGAAVVVEKARTFRFALGVVQDPKEE